MAVPMSRRRKAKPLDKRAMPSAMRPATKMRPVSPAQRGSLRPLPVVDNRPGWLRKLIGLQTAVAGTTLVLIASALGVYGWSVHSQQSWGDSYRRLEVLRRNERQLMAGTEMLKQNIAETANPKTLGLEVRKSENAVFIQPAPARAAASPAPKTKLQKPQSNPLGY
jgi:hypothetical protein